VGRKGPTLALVVGTFEKGPGDVIPARFIVVAKPHGEVVKRVHVTD
jgi:hypothetical protein